MSLGKYFLIFIVQMLGAPMAILSFRYIQPPFFASVVASFGFIFIGGFSIFYVFKNKNKTEVLKSPIFLSGVFFLFCIALPMLFTRLAFSPDVPFGSIEIFFINGNEFHQLATLYYRIMVLLTLIEGAHFWIRSKKKSLI